MKSSYIKLIGPVVSLMLITGNVLGQSVPPPMTIAALQVAVSNLQATVKAQETQITNLQATVKGQTQNGNLQATVNDLSNRLQYVSVVGQDMFITGANLNIVSGSGSTDGTTNGLGNLIVGYNELRTDALDNRTGSHNIVVGLGQNFSSYGGLVAGNFNTISAPYASVSGGYHNTASGVESLVSGGANSTASGDYSSVSGGNGNIASGDLSSVSGGAVNTASGDYSSVSGGAVNTASGDYSSVSGGYNNTASGVESSVSGGSSLVQTNDYGWTGGSYTSP
jgi:hypothetical protein